MRWLDVGVVLLFGGYSVLGWMLIPRTWRGDVPDEPPAGRGARAGWQRFRYAFDGRTCLVHLLVVNDMLLTYLAVRLHDVTGAPAVYAVAAVFLPLFAVLLVLWAVVAATGRPRFLVPPHLR